MITPLLSILKLVVSFKVYPVISAFLVFNTSISPTILSTALPSSIDFVKSLSTGVPLITSTMVILKSTVLLLPMALLA